MTERYIGSTVASRLALVGLHTLYKFHGKKLHPKRNSEGNWVYDRKEVIEFAKWYQKTRPRFKRALMDEGQKAGRAFQMFEAGYTVSEVVMAVELPPATIKSWYGEWLRDHQNLPRAMEVEGDVAVTDLGIKKTALEIKREELAIKKAARKELERKQARRMEREADHDRARDAKENALPEVAKRESTPLSEVFEHAAGGKK